MASAVAQDQIANWMQEMSTFNQIVLKESSKRNIIFVGKARSGKSTMLKVLKEPFELIPAGSIFAETPLPEISHFTVEYSPEGTKEAINYNIGIIDTPGLFEQTPGTESRDVEVLEEMIMNCLNMEIKKISAIFFVIAKGAAINPQDIQSLQRFVKLFEGAEHHIHLLVSKCEDLDDASKKKIEEQYCAHPDFTDLLQKTTSQFHFTGAVLNSVYESGQEDLLKFQMRNTLAMRKEFFDTIFKASEPFDLNTLAMSDGVRIKAEELFGRLKESFSKLPLTNPSTFSAGLDRLRGWTPILSGPIRKEIIEFINQAGKHLEELKNPQPAPV